MYISSQFIAMQKESKKFLVKMKKNLISVTQKDPENTYRLLCESPKKNSLFVLATLWSISIAHVISLFYFSSLCPQDFRIFFCRYQWLPEINIRDLQLFFISDKRAAENFSLFCTLHVTSSLKNFTHVSFFVDLVFFSFQTCLVFSILILNLSND